MVGTTFLQQEGRGLNSRSSWGVWVLSWFSGFLPHSKNMHVRSIGNSRLTLGVHVSVNSSGLALN